MDEMQNSIDSLQDFLSGGGNYNVDPSMLLSVGCVQYLLLHFHWVCVCISLDVFMLFYIHFYGTCDMFWKLDAVYKAHGNNHVF